jgi:feruloyl esterase
MAAALQGGYATASTDTGHVGGRGTFALGHPEKLVDFAWRAVHETTVQSKAMVTALYSKPPRRSYWVSCSTGGRQGLKEAQMFPEDYDGIIAGAPANRTAISLWIAHAVLKDPASYIPPAKYPVIHEAALNACDARDGLKDGLIDDPRKCTFDPKVLLCKGEDGASCLTAPQVEAAKKIYSAAINPRTGREIFASLVPGTELGWGVQARGPEPSTNIYDQYRYVVFKDPNWDWKTFNFDSDVVKGELPENLVMNATDPNMKAFFARGGKLLLYHGWSDSNVPAVNTIKYYQTIVDYMGGVSNTSGSVRLFMAPGMGHCGGGPGVNSFDSIGTLETWVEKGVAPETMIGTGAQGMTRPLCPYPQYAEYKGSGDLKDGKNWSCKAPR